MNVYYISLCVCVTYMGSVKLRPQIQQSMASYVLYFLLEHSAVLAAMHWSGWSIPLHHWWLSSVPGTERKVQWHLASKIWGWEWYSNDIWMIPMRYQWYINDISMMSQWDTAESLDVAETVFTWECEISGNIYEDEARGSREEGFYMAKRHPKKRREKYMIETLFT